ncbi:MAG TPA: NlpC/P60 family protein [Solirubrobacteraceae bacterium]|jgi:cell wall-associated NlpC family hydrolase
MADDLTRGTELIEQLLADPELRRSFRSDPSSVLRERGLDALAEGLPPGERAMLTLELRESRSSLAGVIVAAAAEGVDFTHVAEHAAPRLGRDAGHAISEFFKRLSSHHHPKARPVSHESHRLPKPQVPQLQPAPVGQMATPIQHAAAPAGPAPAAAPAASARAGAEPVSAPAPHHEHHAPELAAGLTAHDPYAYPGNDATSQQIAAWMGANARRVGLPPELPVMASLTESGLRNLDYGDRDSVGFFQMRTSIWDEGPYAGYLTDPQKQIEWFLNEALAVRGSDPSLASDPSRWSEWVADVERPAAEYRGRYQLQLGEAVQLLRGDASLAGGAAVSGAAGAPGATEAVHHVDLGAAVRHSAIAHHAHHHHNHAAGMLDASSSDAGLSVSAGADLVRSAYAAHGVQLPVTAAEQFEVGAAVPRSDLAPGDAVFFGGGHDAIDGVGVYLGGGHVAVGGGREVTMSAPGLHYLGARRYSERLLTGRGSYARTLPTISKHHHHHHH